MKTMDSVQVLIDGVVVTEAKVLTIFIPKRNILLVRQKAWTFW